MLFPGVLIIFFLACQCRLCEQQVSYRLIVVNSMMSSLAAVISEDQSPLCSAPAMLTSEEDVLVDVHSLLSGRNGLSCLSQGASMEFMLVSSVSDATELGFPDFE